jgi:ubiquinone/menaquinone biosynthesis C-methylase UbiE
MRSQIADSSDATLNKRLRQSDRFAWTFDSKGRAIIYDFATPERHLRISETIRTLISCFPGNRTVTVSAVVDTFVRRCGARPHKRELDTLLSTIEKLANLGVLTSQRASRGPYTEEMASFYACSRPVPKDVGAKIISAGKIRKGTRVLDIGTGTGSLAMHLAEASADVTGIDLSRPFLATAKSIAHSRGLKVKFVIEDANKLIFENAQYDVVVISQTFHWLDPGWATRGIVRSLRTNGQLFALESKPVLSARHPFRTLFDYGKESHSSVLRECARHASQYVGLFAQLRPQQLHLIDSFMFRQRRRFDMKFARAYFLPNQLRAAMPNEKAPWAKLEELLAKERPETLDGHMYWLLLCFEKRIRSVVSPSRGTRIATAVLDIPFTEGTN